MSIKGIDAQLMVTRTAELAKDQVISLKNELTQEYMNIQAAEFERQKKQMVSKTNVTENLRLHPDKDKSENNAGYYRRRKKEKKKNDGDPLDELKVAPDPNKKHKIDVKI